MGLCETCTIPIELRKLDVEGIYESHLTNPGVIDAVKALYSAIGELGVCRNGMPDVEELVDGQVTISCAHDLTQFSHGRLLLQVSEGLEESSNAHFSPTSIVDEVANLTEPHQELIAEIIRTESIPASQHGIDQTLLDKFPKSHSTGL